ncbi:uncharacterized protein LOC111999289 [Quercus suber]|uniref:uncharacterized protein LOC111999289 n=1 Tax=Quercus suber TaxID=58331 RepID=UPI000CE1ECA7|nr:uncharacterized protein LOC111999289 [Quercus suber]
MEHALLDLGASVNLIPFSVYQKLGLGELKPTSITLQLVDRSVRESKGIVEDVLVKIEQFYYPVDFIVLDYQFVLHPSVHTPIILGRPFLATTNALINCRNGRMQLTFGSMTLELNIFHVAKQPHEDDDCAYVNLIGAVVQEEFEVLEEQQMMAINKGWKPCFEELLENEKKLMHSSQEAPLLEFKLLPGGLKYAYLGPEGVISEEETVSSQIPAYWDVT